MKFFQKTKRHTEKAEETKQTIEKKQKTGSIAKRVSGAGRFFKRHKKLTVFVILLLLVLAAFGIWRQRSRKQQPDMQQQVIETTEIERMTLSNSISVTGKLVSTDSRTITSKLTDLEVTKVYVQEGDSVKAGDIICEFDATDFEKALAEAKNNVSVQNQLDSLTDSTADYEESIADAEETLADVKEKRDDAKSAYQDAVNTENTRKAEEETAKTAYETVKEEYETKKAAAISALGGNIVDLDSYLNSLEGGTLPEDQAAAKTAVDAYTEVKARYTEAEKAYEAAKTAAETASKDVTEKAAAYEQAQSSREEAQKVYENSVEQAEETYEKAKLEEQKIEKTQDEQNVEQYEEDLEQCVVKATMDGVITGIYVEEGDTFAGGNVYSIQDNENFKVSASVDEYDIPDIEKGMKAYIKTDATGDEELEGTVSYVAVTATESTGNTESGMSAVSSSASYEVEITINGTQERLRSGMTANASIVLEESADTLAVPYDCVQTNEAGEKVIYVEENGEKKEVAVTTGIETDYYTEVISDEISEGMSVYLPVGFLQSSGGDGGGAGGNVDVQMFGGGEVTMSAPAGDGPGGGPGGR